MRRIGREKTGGSAPKAAIEAARVYAIDLVSEQRRVTE